MARGKEPEFDEIRRLLRRLDALHGERAFGAPSRRIEARPLVPLGAQPPMAVTDALAGAAAPRRRPQRPRSAISTIRTSAAVISTVAASIVLVWLVAPSRPVSGPLPPELVAPNALDDTTVETVEVVRHAAW
ncbi:MAG TPA: hypothetical protein PLW75_06280, partial [Hyphomicrobium sp.]|nr:hypothetical protein [Hyphomicrobium sp.]